MVLEEVINSSLSLSRISKLWHSTKDQFVRFRDILLHAGKFQKDKGFVYWLNTKVEGKYFETKHAMIFILNVVA